MKPPVTYAEWNAYLDRLIMAHFKLVTCQFSIQVKFNEFDGRWYSQDGQVV
ncbi:hypothetical protein [Scytonema hofmannii]|uniref:hypothetical protein n=1 Tax=Scytonema hofmannii TaxID=34078 RepID=UPI00034DAB35|nr:hypothetical protein [Scytonema hofmannii]